MHNKTAQQAYASMVKVDLSPGFWARGWSGSGGRYQLPSDSHWVLVGLQKSAYSDLDEVRFAVNLSVVSRAAWEEIAKRPGRQAAPTPNTHPGSQGWWERLGMLASPDHRDLWWSVSMRSDLSEVAGSVLTAFDQFGVPWLRNACESAAPPPAE
jgi:hypothetical protein